MKLEKKKRRDVDEVEVLNILQDKLRLMWNQNEKEKYQKV